MRPLIKASRPLAIATVALLLVLSGCKSKNLPTFPTPPSLPTPSLPSPTPPPTGGMPPPPISSPTPSSSPSQPSSPSQSSKPQMPSSPSDAAKGPKGKESKDGKKGEKSDESGKQAGEPSTGESGDPGDQRAAQTAAGDDLQKAGERIAKAGSGEIDPLIPETDSDSTEDGDVFSDESAATSASADAATNENASENANEGVEAGESGAAGGDAATDAADADGGSPNSGSEQIEGLPSGGIPGDLSDEILAAQDALAKAGDALQEAGSAVANAESDEELAAAEQLLSDARIAVIIASQDIEILEGEMAGTPGWGNAGDDPFQETSAALQEANIALVIATRAVLIAKTGSGEFSSDLPGSGGTQAGSGQVAVLEGELDESLIIFDGQIGNAREAVLSTAPPPESSSPGIQRPDGEISEVMMSLPPDSETPGEPTEQQVATASMPDLNQGDIPDPQGDDIVAQQIREAAMSETDPELQAKLWEEYKRYREGL
jgi:hypothetical protein